jgi:kinesin family protein 18/19
MELLRVSNKNRTQEPTMANETSSRSHAVLQICVEHREKVKGASSEVVVGKLNLIDLAGSERASKTMNRGIRLIEGANINRSLLALGNCINALYEQNERKSKMFIPYRDSKLTRLLKDSLGGNCRTVMIACISPFANSYDDTSNTLKYANRAKNIKTNVKRNVVNVSSHISNYANIIS